MVLFSIATSVETQVFNALDPQTYGGGLNDSRGICQHRNTNSKN
jgi:hypothetical protein